MRKNFHPESTHTLPTLRSYTHIFRDGVVITAAADDAVSVDRAKYIQSFSKIRKEKEK